LKGNTDCDRGFYPYIRILTVISYICLFPAFSWAAQVALAWNANTDAATGYKLYYSTTSGRYGSVIDVGNITTYTVNNLNAGTTYYFAATAYDASGDESGYSNEVAYTIPSSQVPVSSLTITGPTQVNENGSASYTCRATYSDGSSATVTPAWSEDSASASISSTGRLTTASVNSDQHLIISAAYGGRFGSYAVTIIDGQVVVSSLTISGPTQVDENSSASYTCRVVYSDGSSDTVTPAWSEDSATASISSTGRLTTASVNSDQHLIISAAYGGRFGSYAVTIIDGQVSVSSLTITGPRQVNENSSARYTCRAVYSNGSSATVTPIWRDYSRRMSISSSGFLTTSEVDSYRTGTIAAFYSGSEAYLRLTIIDTDTSDTNNQQRYSLTVVNDGLGQVELDPPGNVYDEGTIVRLSAIPEVLWVFDGWVGMVSNPDSNETTVTMTNDTEVGVTFLRDDDGDSVPNLEEFGPSAKDEKFDGNFDELIDAIQQNVASLHSFDYLHYITLSCSETSRLTQCKAVNFNIPGVGSIIQEMEFPVGFFEFDIEDVPISGISVVNFRLPEGVQLNTYYKYGPTPDNHQPHWYEFMYDPVTQTGAEINNNIVTLHFIDGQLGDDDLEANGKIADLGGPGLTTPIQSTGGGGNKWSSNGCFISGLLI